jgi:hypothetical protein
MTKIQGPYNWYFSTGVVRAGDYTHMTLREFIIFLNETCMRMFSDLEIPIGTKMKVTYEGESGTRNFTGTFKYMGRYHIVLEQKKNTKNLDFTHIRDILLL